ncbi:MAG: guanylate kinase [Verrucomicrobia bacterium]|nr:guanylate kinase [Verrucomicrobiota bacterium]
MAEHFGDALLVILSAPSGGGKTTVCQKIVETNSNVVRAITCTTRSPREGERDGIDYYFLDERSFLQRVEAGEFLEHATVHGNHYGTLRSSVFDRLRDGQDVLLSIDVQGAATIRAKAHNDAELRRALVTVFITPPSITVLAERLRKRATDSAEVIEQRLGVARREITEWVNYDYLILSSSISEDVRRMQAILAAEKMRQFRTMAPMKDC